MLEVTFDERGIPYRISLFGTHYLRIGSYLHTIILSIILRTFIFLLVILEIVIDLA